MARIVIVTHEYDQFLHRDRFWQRPKGNYLLFNVLQAMARRGHRWRVAVGPRALPGDAAILHVDSTFVGDDYLALAAHYPVTINFGTFDISKRRVSSALLTRGAAWTGPVIVKSNYNYGGVPEAGHNERAQQAQCPPPHASLVPLRDYMVLPSIADVAEPIWDDSAKVVEPFLPEPDEQGYALRTWVFMGDRERCSRHVSVTPMVKATNSISRLPVAVPEALRAERIRLGFDYGKFDFVMHDGAPVLLDANRTPGRPPATGAAARAGAELLADGMEALIHNQR